MVAVAAFVAGCGGGVEPRACPPGLDGTPELTPPADMALPTGARLYLSEGPFGKTERYYAVMDGAEAELVGKRDVAADALVGAGYKLLAKDDEAPIEAEAHVEGARKVSVRVTTLCDGKLRLRYTVY